MTELRRRIIEELRVREGKGHKQNLIEAATGEAFSSASGMEG